MGTGSVYYYTDNDTLETLSNQGIILANTTSLLATVHLLQKIYRIAQINELGLNIEELYSQVKRLQTETQEFVDKAIKHQINSLKNLQDLKQALEKYDQVIFQRKLGF